MPPVDLPSPHLREPYEDYRYSELRHELAARKIRLRTHGPDRVTRRPGFISLLRDWDATHGNQTTKTPKTQIQTRQTQTQKKKTMAPTTRTVRARRGCRFRLINVLLSPDFNGRWGQMTVGGKLEVNQLWLDVHAAYMAQNSMLDTLHFQDALFVNVTPNVILAHSASRLLQMWAEIVAMYRSAVAQAKDAAAHNDNVHSFFDFCAGRLDLLYLHMAMLLEPKLYELIMSDKIPASDPFTASRPKKAEVATAPVETKVVAKPAVGNKAVESKAAAQPVAKPDTGNVATLDAVPPPVPVKVPAALTQNPEMVEIPTTAILKSTVAAAISKSTVAKSSKSTAKAKQAKPAASPRKPVAQKKPQKAAGKSKLTPSAAEAKPKPSPTQKTNAASSPKLKEPTKSSHKKTFSAHGSTHSRLVNGKRQREEEESSTAIVAVPTVEPVSDIVPHSGTKRVNTTTTISTLATRPTDMMLPPDEWDILESRLRKVNENIDRCHRGLASNGGNVSESYKQSLEADLRFYSAIKQRLQEQLLVVMQSGY